MLMGLFVTVHTPIHSRLLKKENGRLKRGETGRRLVRVSKIVTDAQQVSSREVDYRYSGVIVFLDRDSGTSLMAYCRSRAIQSLFTHVVKWVYRKAIVIHEVSSGL